MNFTFYYLIFQLICIIYGLYLCFIMIFGDNSQFPHLFGINPAEPENPFFHLFDFQGPKRRPNDLIFHGRQFLEGTKRRSEGSEQTEIQGPKEVVPHGQGIWPRGTIYFLPRTSFFADPWLVRLFISKYWAP